MSGEDACPHWFPRHHTYRSVSGRHPICKSMNRTALSEFQDMTADVMQRYCPNIQRGNSKRGRLDAGAQYPETLNRSVRQLHEDLPNEISQKKQAVWDLDADIATRQKSVLKDKDRVADLEAREDLKPPKIASTGPNAPLCAKTSTRTSRCEALFCVTTATTLSRPTGQRAKLAKSIHIICASPKAVSATASPSAAMN